MENKETKQKFIGSETTDCLSDCEVHKMNLYTHNVCLGCKAVKNSPYHKDYFKGMTNKEIEKACKEAIEENA